MAIGGDGSLLHELQRYVVFDGGGAAVFKLGCCVEDFAVAGAEFDADFAVGRDYGGVGAVEAGALLVVDADAESAGFAEEKIFERGDLRVVGEDGEKGAEAALFHLNGGGHDVESTERKSAFGDVGEDLGGEIVDGGFEDGDGVSVGAGCGFVGFADAEAEDVGEVFGVAGAGAVADLLDAHGGLRAEGGGNCSDECGAGRGDEFFFDVSGVDWEAAEQVGGGGRGYGETAVGAVDHATAYVERGREPLLDGEGVDARGDGDDVDDGVDGAYFVEVDLLDRDVVDFGFACAEEFEGVDGGLFDSGGQGCGVNQVADDGEGAAVGVFGSVLVGMSVDVAGFVLVLGFGVVLVGVGLLVVR